MILKELQLKNDDILMFKCNHIRDRKYTWNHSTPFPIYLVGGFSAALNEDLCQFNGTDPENGYDHIGMIGKGYLEKEDANKWYLRHAHPPRASSNELTEEYWKELLAEHDLEVWRFKENLKVSEDDRLAVIDESCKIANFKWNEKKKLYEGVLYNWPAVILAPVTWFFSWFGLRFAVRSIAKHCAEYTFKSNLRIKEVFSPEGKLDPCVSPNEIINAGLSYRLYTLVVNDNGAIIIS